MTAFRKVWNFQTTACIWKALYANYLRMTALSQICLRPRMTVNFSRCLRNKRINEEYIKSDQNIVDLRSDKKDLRAQLDDFLSTNSDLATDPQITMLRAQLSDSTLQNGSEVLK